MQFDVNRDWNWADGYLPEIRRILALNAVYIFEFTVASFEQDVKQATDMLLRVSGQRSIAVRLRRAHYAHRDLTIRAQRRSGAETELSKIAEGHGDLYLYGWTDQARIVDWMLVDLHRLRGSGLLQRQWALISNRDGATSFIAIPYTVLRAHGCVINASITSLS